MVMVILVKIKIGCAIWAHYNNYIYIFIIVAVLTTNENDFDHFDLDHFDRFQLCIMNYAFSILSVVGLRDESLVPPVLQHLSHGVVRHTRAFDGY